MWQSLRISHLILRLSLAVVFLWAGIDKFFHPDHWMLSAHILTRLAGFIHVSAVSVIYALGVVELLVGLSLVINIFVDFFAFVALALIIFSILSYGFGEAAVTSLGLGGGLLSLVFWPSRNFRG